MMTAIITAYAGTYYYYYYYYYYSHVEGLNSDSTNIP